MAKPLSHKSRYKAMRDDTAVLRAETYARWTLPQLMVDLCLVASSGRAQVAVERDYQAMGALLVNNLAAKLAALLFPVSRPFFRISLSETLRQDAERAGHSPTAIAGELARMEMESCQQLFKNASYNQLVTAMKHLITTGNVLLYRDSKNKRSIAYGMNQFTCRRDTRGALLDCVLQEHTFFDALSGEVQQQLRQRNPAKYNQSAHTAEPCRVELYTRIHRITTKANKVIYRVSQEADEIPVGKPGSYPEHLCPWQAPTWNLIAGEHMGRGLVEDYAGDFAKLSDLSLAATLYEVEAAKVLNMAASGSGTDLDKVAQSESGEWITGDPKTVASYESGTADKIDAMRASITDIFSRLARAFMYTANMRDAERVTAVEIQQAALEAENTLGGTYSSLAESLQVPLAHLLITEVRPGILEGIVSDHVVLDIMAGMPALGRSSEVQNLLAAVQEGSVAIQLTQFDNRIDPHRILDLVYAGKSVDTTAIFKDNDVLRAEAEAASTEAEGRQQLTLAAGLQETQEAAQTIGL